MRNFIIFLLFVVSPVFGNVKEYPFAHNNEIINNIIPMSQICIPEDKKELARQKSEKLLSFFKTPEQQFIPLGMYAMVEDVHNVEILRKIRSRGINLAHCYGSCQSSAGALENLAAARQAGIGVLQNLPSAYLIDKDSDWWREHIQVIAKDKQVLFWYLPEEAKPKDVVYLKMLADIIRSEDTVNRPLTTFVANQEGRLWQDVAQIVDVMILGIYPSMMPHTPRADVRRYLDSAYQIGVPVVFSAVEAYKDKKSDHWPTAKEVRFDTYLCLISGSKGILWYCHAALRRNTELYEAVLALASELNGPARLGEVFLMGERENTIRCQLLDGNPYAPPACAYEERRATQKYVYSSLQWLALRHKNAIYLFAVNMNEKIGTPNHGGKDYAVTVKFKNLPDNIINADVLFEDRRLSIDDNSFTDSFDPISTHIYRLEIK